MLVTDEAGQQVWSAEYTPFGKQVSKEGEMERAAKFTGKDLDEDTGLYYFNARWMDAELGRFISEDPMADPNNPNLYTYCRNNPIIYTDPSGLWVDNGDGTFTAQEDDTLWGLSQETGRDWHESDYNDAPEELQIGQVVNMGRRDQRPEGAPVINNTGEAEEHYDNGNGETAWLGDDVLAAVQNSRDQQGREERIRTGATTLDEGNYGVDVVGEGLNWIFGENNAGNREGLFFLGDTTVEYRINSGTKTTIVDFTAFVGDGFWDIPTLFGGPDDGAGPNNERNGSTPYAFFPRSWSISFPNPQNMNWR